MNLNQVVICGRLGKDPEMRYTASGTAVSNFSLAVSSWVKQDDPDNPYKENVTWIDVTCWGKNAERAAKQAQKGTEALVIGRIDTRSWEDAKDATIKHFRTFVTAINLQLGHGRVPAEDAGTGEQSQEAPAGTTADAPPAAPPATSAEEEDDLPF